MSYLLGLCGSLRAASFNRQLMHEARRLYDPAAFEEGNLRLPLYDGDLEAKGMPPEVQTLADQIDGAEAVIIASPEYNKAPSGVLKNALDWVSRVEGRPWKDKPVAIMSAAAGRAGGERMQAHLRLMLHPFSANVLHLPEVFIGQTAAQFNDDGKLTDEFAVKFLTAQMEALRAMVG